MGDSTVKIPHGHWSPCPRSRRAWRWYSVIVEGIIVITCGGYGGRGGRYCGGCYGVGVGIRGGCDIGTDGVGVYVIVVGIGIGVWVWDHTRGWGCVTRGRGDIMLPRGHGHPR